MGHYLKYNITRQREDFIKHAITGIRDII